MLKAMRSLPLMKSSAEFEERLKLWRDLDSVGSAVEFRVKDTLQPGRQWEQRYDPGKITTKPVCGPLCDTFSERSYGRRIEPGREEESSVKVNCWDKIDRIERDDGEPGVSDSCRDSDSFELRADIPPDNSRRKKPGRCTKNAPPRPLLIVGAEFELLSMRTEDRLEIASECRQGEPLIAVMRPEDPRRGVPGPRTNVAPTDEWEEMLLREIGGGVLINKGVVEASHDPTTEVQPRLTADAGISPCLECAHGGQNPRRAKIVGVPAERSQRRVSARLLE